MGDDAPSVGKLAGQLGFMFDDDPSLRDAPVAQLVARLNEEDRLARVIAKYPNRSDAEIHRHLAEFHDRIGAVEVEQARQQALGRGLTRGPFRGDRAEEIPADFRYTDWVR